MCVGGGAEVPVPSATDAFGARHSMGKLQEIFFGDGL